MLKNMSELAKDAISKNAIVFKVFLEKTLKLLPYHLILGFKKTFLLILLLNYCFAKKHNWKKDIM